MNKEENDNHILIEILNKNGDLKLTKFRNPRAIWQNYDYPDEYIFRDVDIVNIFQLLQENQSLEKENKILRENAEHNDKVVDKVNWENQKLKYNWNKLRETLKNEQLASILYSDKKRFADIDEILLKMQELEKSDGNK